MGHDPHSSKLVVICVLLLLFVLFYVLFAFVLFYILFVCKCVLYYCDRVLTELQLTNILYHVKYESSDLYDVVFEDCILLGYDGSSLDDQFPTFRKIIFKSAGVVREIISMLLTLIPQP